jgi:predicted RNase H-like nuclease (RuvC/YqgF family)
MISFQKIDKEHNALPSVVKNMTNEMKILKAANAQLLIKLQHAERSSKTHLEESMKNQEQINKMSILLKAKNLEDNDKLQKTIEKMKQELVEKESQIVELTRKIKQPEQLKSLEVRDLKNKNFKLHKEIEDLKAQYNEKINELQVVFYSTSFCRKRTYKDLFYRTKREKYQPCRYTA